MLEGPLSARTQREQEAFNKELQRDGYMQVFDRACHLFLQRRDKIICDEFQYVQGKDALELGSVAWKVWMEDIVGTRE